MTKSIAHLVQYWREYLREHPNAIGRLDFETRSACDLKVHGVWVYSKHPTTIAMCLAYKLPEYAEPELWHMAHPQHLISESEQPWDLFAFILAGGLLEAHNVFFDRCIWTHVMMVQHGWPSVDQSQWRCSASKANAASLPRDLKNATIAMGLNQLKDDAGHKIMLKLCKPRKPRKAERVEWKAANGDKPMPILWNEDEQDLLDNWKYCKQDVRAEEALSEAIPELSEEELAVWQVDQAMNWRGLKFDLDLAVAALAMAARWRTQLNTELEAMTGISAGTKRQQIKAWLEENEDLVLPDTAAETLEWYINNVPISGRAQRICQIVRDVNRTSTRKYQAMLDKADPDDWRIRDLLMYHGAGTGRWSGKGVQIHNFPARDLIVKDFEEAAADIKSGNMEWCVAMYGDVMKLLSHALRGAIIPDEGMEFLVADYSAIEARCVLWEADATEALDIFRGGGDIYCDMATGIYGYQVEKATHKSERQFGKQAILGLGYGMGFLTFLLTCRKYDIHFSHSDVLRIMGAEKLAKMKSWVKNYLMIGVDLSKIKDKQSKMQARKANARLVEAREVPAEIVHELALMKYTVDVYRSRYPEVKAMWGNQEAAAIEAVSLWEKIVKDARKIASASTTVDNISYGQMEYETTAWRDQFEGPIIQCHPVSWQVKNGFLHCWLPSGRPIRYRDPEIKLIKTTWGESKPALRYMSVNGVTRKWERTHTYGGKIVENITQAIARDVMATAMLLADKGDIYIPVMSVHDELVAEVAKGTGSVDGFEDLLSDIAPYMAGCPIAAEGERLTRYKK